MTALAAAVAALGAADNGGRALIWGAVGLVLAAVSIRCAIGLHPHSGMGKPPMFGDFEAQRHWMEITTSLPLADWYRSTPDNDLLYWGLDYPPLTAYHSYLCGRVLGWLEPESMALSTSRGYETPSSKAAMRATVLAGDVVVYFPAAFLFVAAFYRGEGARKQLWALLVLLLQPALLIIDHGHFQYNAISLGLHALGLAALVVAASRSTSAGGDGSTTAVHGRSAGASEFAATVAICMAINYKQMGLYLAWPPFVFLVSANLRSENPVRGIAVLVTAAIGTFIVCWLPFLLQPDPVGAVGAVLQRQFPFDRGLYEDKVANVWCSLSLVLKLNKLLETSSLLALCSAATLGALLPSTLMLARRPNAAGLLYASVCAGLAFFLFSFQVHEKSVLLPLLPALLLAGREPFAATCVLAACPCLFCGAVYVQRMTLVRMQVVYDAGHVFDVSTPEKGRTSARLLRPAAGVQSSHRAT
eukprot:COSAG01_NODE_3889_length_5578_cov_202.537324_7_plen_472_part_00